MSRLRSINDMTRQAAVAYPAGISTAEELTDRELLQRFVRARDENAFTALVERHGAMVLAICRQWLALAQDAEDVCQVTFLILARKAAVVPWQDSIRCWLRAVARQLSLQKRSAAARRARHTAEPTCDGDLPERIDRHADPVEEIARRELRLVLDQELSQLPEKYRAPVILCYLEGKSNEQAAGELGWPTGSMSRRLARARALLRDRLSRRGLALTVAFVCLALGWHKLAPLPTPDTGPKIAQAMASFQLKIGDRAAFDTALGQIAERDAETKEDRERFLQATQLAIQVADVIEGHDPGFQRNDWKRYAVQMRRSSLELAKALAGHDRQATQMAARQLAMTCQACHAIFRD
jgi:RNA polymerase sigma-70 factor (ECF subfamily)